MDERTKTSITLRFKALEERCTQLREHFQKSTEAPNAVWSKRWPQVYAQESLLKELTVSTLALHKSLIHEMCVDIQNKYENSTLPSDYVLDLMRAITFFTKKYFNMVGPPYEGIYNILRGNKRVEDGAEEIEALSKYLPSAPLAVSSHEMSGILLLSAALEYRKHHSAENLSKMLQELEMLGRNVETSVFLELFAQFSGVY